MRKDTKLFHVQMFSDCIGIKNIQEILDNKMIIVNRTNTHFIFLSCPLLLYITYIVQGEIQLTYNFSYHAIYSIMINV